MISGRLTGRDIVVKNDNIMEDKCVFDSARMCMIHECEAVEVNVKVSRYKKETVTKLKCSENRVGGSTVSDNASVQSASDPAGKL